MTVNELSASTQNYLKAIWSLAEWSDEPVTTSSLAGKVGVKLSTVSDALKKLSEQGLIEHEPYGAITLTEVGRSHALAMVRRHRLIETFLVETLGYRWDQVHDEAETLEHAVSDFMIERIDEHLGSPTRDPHGDPIPTRDGLIDMPRAVSLHATTPGSRLLVERISDADPALLQYFADHGIGFGTVVTSQSSAPFSDTVTIQVEGSPQTITLGAAASQSVWVTRLD